MTSFQHSQVLFFGDDGLPLEFNIRNTNERARLKNLIEYGGGICSQSETAIHLITEGTKILNVDSGKKLVSSRYVLDCVRDNYLLNVDDYVFTVNEAPTSDLSDDDDDPPVKSPVKFYPKKRKFDKRSNERRNVSDSDLEISNFNRSQSGGSSIISESVDEFAIVSANKPKSKKMPTQTSNNSSTVSNLENDEIPSSNRLLQATKYNDVMQNSSNSESLIESSIGKTNHPKLSFQFETGNKTSNANRNIVDPLDTQIVLDSSSQPYCSTQKHLGVQMTIPDNFEEIPEDLDDLAGAIAALSTPFFKDAENKASPKSKDTCAVEEDSPVTSSQPEGDNGELDEFDKNLVRKAMMSVENEVKEILSQSQTVSSSQDVEAPQHTSKTEFFHNSPDLPDSPEDDFNDHKRKYIEALEEDVKNVLIKPAPKSIQDKITLVKYICVIKKLPPSVVIQSLQTL